MKEITRETNRKIQQLFGGIKPIKVQGMERPFIEEFEHYSHREAILQSKQQILMLAPKQVIEPIAFGGLVLIVLIASGRGESITSLIPNLGLMAFAAYRLLPNVQAIYAAAMGIGSHAHVLEEVLEEFEGVPNSSLKLIRGKTVVESPLPWQDKIYLDRLSFRYPSSENFVIKDLSITIPKNGSVAIVGSTGCGKSTLVDLILGLHRPTSGEIVVDGKRLDSTNIRAWQAGIGYVPQDIFLLDDTIRANIALGVAESEIDEARLREVCEAAQILSFIEKDLAKSWHTMVGERGVRLSGGQRQRLGLARALYRRPELLILDEATSALDVDTEAAVVEAVRAISGSLTMIIIAHRLSTIEWCDSVLNLQRAEAEVE
jgi:ATP-binding cassette subfamily C protein